MANIKVQGTASGSGTITINPPTTSTDRTQTLPDLDGPLVGSTGTTGSVVLPVGTTAQRDVSPNEGYIRFNSTISSFEGYDGTAWRGVGGSARGGGSNEVFVENDIIVTTDYTISTGKNAMSTGPLTINSGVTITIPSGSVWKII